MRVMRVVKMGHKWYGMEVDLGRDLDNIEYFIKSGEPVLLAYDLDEAECAINEEITVVEPE